MYFVMEFGLTNPWLTFSKYANSVTTDCTNTMLAQWKGRLGGTNEFNGNHCWKITESQLVDYH